MCGVLNISQVKHTNGVVGVRLESWSVLHTMYIVLRPVLNIF